MTTEQLSDVEVPKHSSGLERRHELQEFIRTEEEKFRQQYDDLLAKAYQEAEQQGITESDQEQWALDQIETEVQRLLSESEEVLQPLRQELGLLEEYLQNDAEQTEGDSATSVEPALTQEEEKVQALQPESPSPNIHPSKENRSSEKAKEQNHPKVLLGIDRIQKRGSKTALKNQGGLLVVEGTDDMEQLAEVELLSVALDGKTASSLQRKQLVQLADEYAESRAQLLLPLDKEGRQAMLKLMQQLVTEVYVKVAWTSQLEGGRFKEKAPADLTKEELQALCSLLTK